MNTSVIVLIAVALWLVWVAPMALRRRRDHLATDGAVSFAEPVAAPAAAPAPRMHGAMAMESMQLQEKTMERNTSSAHGAGVSDDAPVPDLLRPAPLKIRYGRTALALVGLLALPTAAITGIGRLLGAVSGLVPLGAFILFAGTLFVLRALAVRDRRRRLSRAFQDAMGSTTTAAPAAAAPASTPAAKPATTVFDGADTVAAPAEPAPKPLTAADLRQAALAVAAKGTADAKLAHTETVAWEPIEIPAPGYVAAPKADRPEPAPLELPEAPKATAVTSIKADLAGVGAGADDPTAKKVVVASTSSAPLPPAGKARPAHGLSNLDDVLQRRRV
ncbi:hypothetical protein ACQCSX_10245 [Pseudarthrobacter sp. P1]|uniref:hypothetical protein n=1 Tax=Pseudarthrobacter sp. P1 TaxID=3418418 RepID=UPI003CED41FB